MVYISCIYTTLHWKWKQWAIWTIPLTFCWITLALWRVWLIELKLVFGWWGRSCDKIINFWQGYCFSHCPALWKYIVVHYTGLGGGESKVRIGSMIYCWSDITLKGICDLIVEQSKYRSGWQNPLKGFYYWKCCALIGSMCVIHHILFCVFLLVN